MKTGGEGAQTARSPLAVVRAAVQVAVGAAVLTGVVLAAVFTVLNDWGSAARSVALAAWLVALYGLVNLVGLGGVVVIALALGRRPGVRFFAGVTIVFYLLLNGALRFNPAIQPFGVVPSLNAIGALDVTFLAIVAYAAGRGILRSQVGWLLAAAGLLFGLWQFNLWHERPLARPVASDLVPAGLPDDGPQSAGEAEVFARARLVVLGLDGLSWEVLSPMVARGDLPEFASFLRRAAYGHLETLPFPVSPVVWETIATGQGPSRHGIGYHQHFEFPGIDGRLRRFPDFRLCNSAMGIRRLLTFTAPWAPWRGVPAEARDARVARFWEIVSRRGLSVGVYRWLNTAPAVPVHGFVHAFGFAEPLDFPPDLQRDLPRLPASAPGVLPGMDWARRELSVERDLYRRFVTLALRHQPEVLLFYTHYADSVNHLNWKNETVGDAFFFSGLRAPRVEPGPTMSLAHRFLDEIVRDMRARLPESARLVIVSDHGFDFRGYEHDNAPPGVFLAAGPGIRPGVVEGARVADVTPTLLHLLGLPVADDMEGRPLAIAEPGGSLDRAVARVRTHGPSGVAITHPGERDAPGLREHEEYLRALGYVN